MVWASRLRNASSYEVGFCPVGAGSDGSTGGGGGGGIEKVGMVSVYSWRRASRTLEDPVLANRFTGRTARNERESLVSAKFEQYCYRKERGRNDCTDLWWLVNPEDPHSLCLESESRVRPEVRLRKRIECTPSRPTPFSTHAVDPVGGPSASRASLCESRIKTSGAKLARAVPPFSSVEVNDRLSLSPCPPVPLKISV